jgi:hypothetical protein
LVLLPEHGSKVHSTEINTCPSSQR